MNLIDKIKELCLNSYKLIVILGIVFLSESIMMLILS